MKPLKYSINSWHFKFFRNAYPLMNQPHNICNYFWLLIFAIITLPITFIGRIANIRYQNIEISIQILSQFIIGLLLAFMIMAGEKILPTEAWWLQLITGAFILSLSLIIAFCIIYLAIRYQDRKEVKKHSPNPLIEGFKVFKGKYCSRIEWIDNEKNN